MIKLSEVRQRLVYSPEEEPWIKNALAAAIKLFEDRSKRLWNKRTGYVQTWRIGVSHREPILWLDLFPHVSITTLEERGANALWSAADAVKTTDYVLDEDRGELERIAGQWSANVRATYDGGFDDTTNRPPEDVRLAIVTQVVFWHHRLKPNLVHVDRTSQRGHSAQFFKAGAHPLLEETARNNIRTSMLI